MTGSGPRLGVLLLLAVLLQTVVVTITVLHFSTALNSVSSLGAGPGPRDPPGSLTDSSVGPGRGFGGSVGGLGRPTAE